MAQVKDKESNNLIEEMFGAGAHYGYSKSRRHPSAKALIYGSKNNVEIFNLEKTGKLLKEALEFVEELGKSGKNLLLVSGKKEAKSSIKKAAEELSLPHVAGRWIGGTLTNFREIKKRIQRYLNLKEQKEKGELSKYTKKERLLIDREMEDLFSKFGGIIEMNELPVAVFVIDSKQEKTTVTEAGKMNIPVIALSSSDCNLEEIDYPIPGNDSAISSIEFFVSKIVDAYKKGLKTSE